MEWCKGNRYYQRHALKDQMRLMGQASARVREFKRLNAEPELYHPLGRKFCGVIYSLNCQYETPVEQTIILLDTDYRTSYRAIVNNICMDGRGGWHDWHELNAKAMQQRFLTAR